MGQIFDQPLTHNFRQAQQLGLHRLPQSVRQTAESTLESTLVDIWDLELQKRLWARLFVLDRSVSLTIIQLF